MGGGEHPALTCPGTPSMIAKAGKTTVPVAALHRRTKLPAAIKESSRKASTSFVGSRFLIGRRDKTGKTVTREGNDLFRAALAAQRVVLQAPVDAICQFGSVATEVSGDDGRGEMASKMVIDVADLRDRCLDALGHGHSRPLRVGGRASYPSPQPDRAGEMRLQLVDLSV